MVRPNKSKQTEKPGGRENRVHPGSDLRKSGKVTIEKSQAVRDEWENKTQSSYGIQSQ